MSSSPPMTGERLVWNPKVAAESGDARMRFLMHVRTTATRAVPACGDGTTGVGASVMTGNQCPSGE